jgi:hypothetical protein
VPLNPANPLQNLLALFERQLAEIIRKMPGQASAFLRRDVRVVPIEGLVSSEEITFAKRDWHAACDAFHTHARNRIKKVQRVCEYTAIRSNP